MMTEIIAQRRPIMELNGSSHWLAFCPPTTLASVVTGMPIDPNATGAVFASRQMPAA